jgi:hypothetical protein
MPDYASPAQMTPEQRAWATAQMHERAARVMDRLASDPRQSKRVRSANARDAEAARLLAARARAA